MKNLKNGEFIQRSINKHGDKYDYSKVKYDTNKTKVVIICPEISKLLPMLIQTFSYTLLYDVRILTTMVDYDCVIYPNSFRLRGKDFDIDFIPKGGSTKDVVGKDLKFMNSVLNTIAECIIDFINKNDVVKKIRFQTHGIREKAYIRFFRNHQYFSKFEIDDSYEYSGFVEIYK